MRIESVEHTRSWDGKTTLVVVLGDFGRVAAVRFVSSLSEREREVITAQLSPGEPFYDEHRRIAVAFHGDLRFTKELHLAPYLNSGRPLDEKVLVGFPGGPTTDQVEDRLGVMALEAMAGSVSRGITDVVVCIPCNTLAPVSWSLGDQFSDEAALVEMIARSGMERPDLLPVLPLVARECSVHFPTVPEAAVHRAREEGAGRVLPLGTGKIAHIYREAIRRNDLDLELVDLDDLAHRKVLDAITASIDGSSERRTAARQQLLDIERTARDAAETELAVISACTDLDYGIGLDPDQAYARHTVDLVYG